MSRILNEISFGSRLKTGMYYITGHFNNSIASADTENMICKWAHVKTVEL